MGLREAYHGVKHWIGQAIAIIRSNNPLSLEDPGNAKAAKDVRDPEEFQLPDDALFIIFSKLASQDPPALLAASAACKTFRALASSHASLWRSAFYSPSQPPRPHEPEAKAFQELVQRFGGYEGLVRARWAKPLSGLLSSDKNERSCSEESLTKIKSRSEISFLVLVRTSQGGLCLYGLGLASSEVKDALKNSRFFTRISHLYPLIPVKDLPAEITRVSWADVNVQLEAYVAFGGGSPERAPLYKRKKQAQYSRCYDFDNGACLCWYFINRELHDYNRGNAEVCLHATIEDAQYNGTRSPSEASANQRPLGAFLD